MPANHTMLRYKSYATLGSLRCRQFDKINKGNHALASLVRLIGVARINQSSYSLNLGLGHGNLVTFAPMH